MKKQVCQLVALLILSCVMLTGCLKTTPGTSSTDHDSAWSDDSAAVPADSSEKPSEVPSEVPSEIPSEVPSEVPSEIPSEVPSEQPSDTSQASDAVSELPIKPDNDITSQVEVVLKPMLNGNLCAFITNHSNTIIDELTLQVKFTDKEGMIIDLDEDGHDMILPEQTVVSEIKAPSEYADYVAEIQTKIGVYPSYKNHLDNVEIQSNIGNNCIIVQITNHDTVEIDEIEYIVVFYNGTEINSVSYENDVYHVAAGATITEKIDVPDTYTRYEIYLNQAHTFGIFGF